MGDVHQLYPKKKPPAPWPAAANLREAFSIAVAATIWFADQDPRPELPVISVAGTAFDLLSVFAVASLLDPPFPVGDQALLLALHRPGGDPAAYTTYAGACSRLEKALRGWLGDNGRGGAA